MQRDILYRLQEDSHNSPQCTSVNSRARRYRSVSVQAAGSLRTRDEGHIPSLTLKPGNCLQSLWHESTFERPKKLEIDAHACKRHTHSIRMEYFKLKPCSSFFPFSFHNRCMTIGWNYSHQGSLSSLSLLAHMPIISQNTHSLHGSVPANLLGISKTSQVNNED